MPFDGTDYAPDSLRILIEARALVEKGWCKDREVKIRLFHPNQYCVLGALSKAYSNLNPKAAEEYKVAARAFSHAIGGGSIAGWNDAPSRRKQHVLAAFDRAIIELS